MKGIILIDLGLSLEHHIIPLELNTVHNLAPHMHHLERNTLHNLEHQGQGSQDHRTCNPQVIRECRPCPWIEILYIPMKTTMLTTMATQVTHHRHTKLPQEEDHRLAMQLEIQDYARWLKKVKTATRMLWASPLRNIILRIKFLGTFRTNHRSDLQEKAVRQKI